MREALVNRDGGKHHGQTARQHDAALRALDQIGRIAVAGIVIAVRIGDADDRTVERVIGIPHRLDEGLPQKQRETRIAVAGESLT